MHSRKDYRLLLRFRFYITVSYTEVLSILVTLVVACLIYSSIFISFQNLILFIVTVCMLVCEVYVRTNTCSLACVWRSEDNFQELVFSFHHGCYGVRSGGQASALRTSTCWATSLAHLLPLLVSKQECQFFRRQSVSRQEISL